jgi:hypothetical protein
MASDASHRWVLRFATCTIALSLLAMYFGASTRARNFPVRLHATPAALRWLRKLVVAEGHDDEFGHIEVFFSECLRALRKLARLRRAANFDAKCA